MQNHSYFWIVLVREGNGFTAWVRSKLGGGAVHGGCSGATKEEALAAVRRTWNVATVVDNTEVKG